MSKDSNQPNVYFSGMRKSNISSANYHTYQSNDTLAKKIWDSLENTILPVRSRDIISNRFPLKDIWDVCSLGQTFLRSDLNFNQKTTFLRYYFNGGGVDNLLASLTRSGQAWSELTFAIALDLANGGEGNYAYNDDEWFAPNGYIYCKMDWRSAIGIKDEHRVYDLSNSIHQHTHHAYYRTRCRPVKKMKVVILLRSILESLESNFYKIAQSPKWPEITLDEQTFLWERYLDDAIEFFNSWGDVATWHPSCMVVKYHEMKQDPPGMHKKIADFWGIDIPLECIEEALKRTSKKSMAEKIPDNEKETVTRVSYRAERGALSQDLLEYILGRLKREVIHDFGYDYSGSHQWGKHYD